MTPPPSALSPPTALSCALLATHLRAQSGHRSPFLRIGIGINVRKSHDYTQNGVDSWLCDKSGTETDVASARDESFVKLAFVTTVCLAGE